ncbi:hypothetical protein I204_07005 [Kwoniella mangroviensis CBS 8886]|nr:hypothetical protein I204_07005 [Kwoniella mangroviensis CBS 8886]
MTKTASEYKYEQTTSLQGSDVRSTFTSTPSSSVSSMGPKFGLAVAGKIEVEYLPDPDEFPGVKFILDTLNPPRLVNRHSHGLNPSPICRGRLRYFERDERHKWWFTRWFHPAPHWLTFFWYRSTAGTRVSCTREELCFAWVKALNGARYHQLLYSHSQQIADRVIKARYESTIENLAVVAKKWLSLFREIDWAMGILYNIQLHRTIPLFWRYHPEEHDYDISKLSKWKHRLTCLSTAEDLTECFIYCVRETIRLDKKGYDHESRQLATAIGFPGHKICKVPGIPDEMRYDDDNSLTGNW